MSRASVDYTPFSLVPRAVSSDSQGQAGMISASSRSLDSTWEVSDCQLFHAEILQLSAVGWTGTSTDVSRYAGEYEIVFETTTAGISIQSPQLDISEYCQRTQVFRTGLVLIHIVLVVRRHRGGRGRKQAVLPQRPLRDWTGKRRRTSWTGSLSKGRPSGRH